MTENLTGRAWYAARYGEEAAAHLYGTGEEPSFTACAECGHLHWNPYVGRYERCPQAAEGCMCPYAEGEDQ